VDESKLERTDWIPASVNPVRAGMYECFYYDPNGSEEYQFIVKRKWTGSKWINSKGAVPTCFFGTVEGDCWRGLTKKAHDHVLGQINQERKGEAKDLPRKRKARRVGPHL